MAMTFPERMVSEETGIEQVAFCQAILERMYDDATRAGYAGLSALPKREFQAFARRAAIDMFPAAMGVKKPCA